MRRLITAFCVLCVLSIPIDAGEVSTPGIVQPPPQPACETCSTLPDDLTIELLEILVSMMRP